MPKEVQLLVGQNPAQILSKLEEPLFSYYWQSNHIILKEFPQTAKDGTTICGTWFLIYIFLFLYSLFCYRTFPSISSTAEVTQLVGPILENCCLIAVSRWKKVRNVYFAILLGKEPFSNNGQNLSLQLLTTQNPEQIRSKLEQPPFSYYWQSNRTILQEFPQTEKDGRTILGIWFLIFFLYSFILYFVTELSHQNLLLPKYWLDQSWIIVVHVVTQIEIYSFAYHWPSHPSPTKARTSPTN